MVVFTFSHSESSENPHTDSLTRWLAPYVTDCRLSWVDLRVGRVLFANARTARHAYRAIIKVQHALGFVRSQHCRVG